MKVLAISNLFPSAHEPTRGMFNKQVFQALSGFCDVQVISPGPWWTRVKRPGTLLTIPRQEIGGMQAQYPAFWGLPKAGVRYNGKLMYQSLRGPVAKLRKQFPFDAILAAWAYPDAYAAACLAQEFGCPLVTKLMGSDVNDLSTRPELQAKIAWALKNSSRVIAVSDALRVKSWELGVDPARIVVQHNGVNGELFAIRDRQEARQKLGLPMDRKLVVYIGNFYPVKGTDILVAAMERLAKQRPDVDLCLVGSGDLEPGLRARVASAGLEERIRFMGRQPHDLVPVWMCASDVFCLPSRNEGCPNVVLEALASGRPVVASKVGGIPELLKDHTGLLVPSENPEALAGGLSTALDRAWNSQELRSSVEFLSWNEVGQSYFGIIKDACKSPVSR